MPICFHEKLFHKMETYDDGGELLSDRSRLQYDRGIRRQSPYILRRLLGLLLLGSWFLTCAEDNEINKIFSSFPKKLMILYFDIKF